jgi:hypothetical protein
MIQIPAACIEFNEQGNTIWVHSPEGATILRIKTMGKLVIQGECENIVSHSDMIVKEDIHICLAHDAKGVDDIDRLKQTFDAIGVPYVVVNQPHENGDVYQRLYTSNEEEQANGKLEESWEDRWFKQRTLFEFCNGTVASTP